MWANEVLDGRTCSIKIEMGFFFYARKTLYFTILHYLIHGKFPSEIFQPVLF